MERIIKRITIFHMPRSIFVLDIVTAGETLRYREREMQPRMPHRCADRAVGAFPSETIAPLIGSTIHNGDSSRSLISTSGNKPDRSENTNARYERSCTRSSRGSRESYQNLLKIWTRKAPDDFVGTVGRIDIRGSPIDIPRRHERVVHQKESCLFVPAVR